MKKKLALTCIALLCGSLMGCGGGGDGDDDDGGPVVPEEEDYGGGIWEGTFRIDGEAESRGMFALATEEGDVVIVATGHRIFFGKVNASGNGFSGTAWSYEIAGPDGPPQPGRLSATLLGTVAPNGSISGSYSLAGESGTFNLAAMDFLYERGASLARLAGVYSVPPNATGYTLTVSIGSDGAFTLNASTPEGCMVNGTVQVVRPQFNYYRWTGTQTSCSQNSDGPVKGFMYLGDLLGQNNYLRIFVQTQAETAGTWLGVTK